MIIPRPANLFRTLPGAAIAAAFGLASFSGQAQEEKPRPEPRPEERAAGEKPEGRPGPPREDGRPEDGRPEDGRPEDGRREDGPRMDKPHRDTLRDDKPHGDRAKPEEPSRPHHGDKPKGEHGGPDALHHLIAAAMHLEQAGLPDEAHRLRARAEEMKRHHRERGQGRPGHGDARLEEQLKEMRHRHEDLRAEVAKLREELQDRPRGDQEGAGKGPAR